MNIKMNFKGTVSDMIDFLNGLSADIKVNCNAELVLQSNSIDPFPEGLTESERKGFVSVKERIDNGSIKGKIEAIKEFRLWTGYGLKESKDFIEKHFEWLDTPMTTY